jgi:hypothetical protein
MRTNEIQALLDCTAISSVHRVCRYYYTAGDRRFSGRKEAVAHCKSAKKIITYLRYQVVVNGEIVKNYKQRRSANRFLKKLLTN